MSTSEYYQCKLNVLQIEIKKLAVRGLCSGHSSSNTVVVPVVVVVVVVVVVEVVVVALQC